jgi:hypothetical protein
MVDLADIREPEGLQIDRDVATTGEEREILLPSNTKGLGTEKRDKLFLRYLG